MNSLFPKLAGALIVTGAVLYAVPAYAANDAMSRAEARQMTEQFTPQAQYELSRREAYAAYQETLKACHETVKADRSCTKNAQKQLQQDLADAKQHLQGDTNMGSSGTIGNTGSGKHANTGLMK
jgi:hypothetical protein